MSVPVSWRIGRCSACGAAARQAVPDGWWIHDFGVRTCEYRNNPSKGPCEFVPASAA